MHRTRLCAFVLMWLLLACTQREQQNARTDTGSLLPDRQARQDSLKPYLLSGRRNGSQLLLIGVDHRRYALVVDDEAEAVRVIDPYRLRQSSMKWVGGRPGQMLLGPNGRIYVTQRDRSSIAVLQLHGGEPPWLRQVGQIATDTEPQGLALTPSGDLVVTAGWGRSLAVYSRDEGLRTLRVVLAREPRSVVVTDDGRFAYVTHALGGQITRVALASGESTAISLAGKDIAISRTRDGVRQSVVYRRTASQGFALAALDHKLFAPGILVHRGPRTIVNGYGERAGFPSQQPAVATLTAGENEAILRVQNRHFAAHQARQDFSGDIGRYGCMLPRDAVVDRAHDQLLITCVDRHQVLAFSTADAPLSASAKGRWRVPSGPMGIDVDPETQRALVWSQYAQALSAIPLATKHHKDPLVGQRVVTALLEDLDPAYEDNSQRLGQHRMLGRKLFHMGGSLRVSADGRACASCHIDGRDDGLTWPSPSGARQTPMLAGRLEGTAPYGWHGETHDLLVQLKESVRRLGGSGLRDREMRSMRDYVLALPLPMQTRSTAAQPAQQALVAQGRELFHDETVGCASCHKEATLSDGASHEVGSGVKLDTPSLRFIAGTAPYFHDGRYQTLGELLEATSGTMGWRRLDKPQLRAMEAYLNTL